MPRHALLAALLLPLLAACGDTPPPTPPPDPSADAAFALLTHLDPDAVAEAYRRLDGYAYTAEVTLSVHDGDGSRTASRTLVRRPTDDGVEEQLVAEAGDGALGRGWPERLRLQNPLPALLPDEPAFLSSRSREDYRYRFGPDTTVEGQRLRVVEASLRPGSGSDQAVRRARYLLRPGTDGVLGVEVERRTTSALYDEDARVLVLLQPGPDGALVPAHAVTETMVDVAGAAPRHLQIAQRFRDVEAAGG